MNDMNIGGMHADLGIDVRGWFDGLKDAQSGLADFAHEVMAQFKELEATIRNVGLGLTAAISVPFAGMAIVSKRGAGAFEKSMNNVNAALRGIDGAQLTALSNAARKLGPEVGRSAKEAADGIETLALAGMGAGDILNGGLAQTLRLAAANAAGLGESAAVVTDVMAQFGKTSGDLEEVVNQVTGALDASKLGFNDFKDAIAQGGGVAGAAGVSFADFNTALAGTAALFGSGSDAGTSFKTFITTLTPKSNEAAGVMKKLGLEFYDASGRMKDLATIAEMLREKLGNLSDRSRTTALTEMFGADAMRTAIGLMRLGGQAFDDLQKTIGETDAGEKLAIQLDGLESASNDLAISFDNLKIALGEAGILAVFTAATKALTSMTQALADTPLWLREIAIATWGVAAAAGPMVLALLGIAKVVAPILLARGLLGGIGIVIAALINPLGAAIALLAKFALGLTGVSVAARAVVTALVPLGWAVGLVVTSLTLLYFWSNRTVEANKAAKQAATNAAAAYDKQQKASLGLVAATGKARESIIAKMKADRAAELQAMATAKADVIAARAALERAKSNLSNVKSEVVMTARGDMISPKVAPAIKAVKEEEANLLARAKALETYAKTVEGYNRSINTPEFGTVDMSFDKPDPERAGRKGSGPSAQELADRREMMKLEQQLAVARARDDKDQERIIQDQIDLIQRRNDYEQAGLDRTSARVAAEKDILELKAAEDEYSAREIAKAEDALDLQLAEIRGDHVLARLKADKAYLEERITHWQSKGLTLLEAQRRATEDLVQMDAARADAAARRATADALDREAELSRLRGDTDARQRQASRAAEIERRTRRYEEDGDGKVSEQDARDRATREVDEEDMARQQGEWRDTFKGGIRAAMDGDLKGFVKNWWKDRVAKGMEEALNSLSDMLFNLFRQALGQGGAAGAQGGGGILGSILGGIGSIFGGSGTGVGGGIGGGLPGAGGPIMNMNALNNAFAGLSSLPKFATGGSFEIGGKPGIDSNLVQFWGTAGETVNVRRPGNDNGGGGDTYHFSGNLMTPEFWAQIQAGDAAARSGAVATVERRGAKRAARRLGR